MQLSNKRIHSIDILRGMVIVIMAIDHIRDMWALTPFQPEDIVNTTPGWFFTRWITHFCAPVFVFLAGTAAFLYYQKINSRKDLSRFLLTRGLWLVFIELVWINFSWSLTLPWNSWGLFIQVIWAIGISMIVLSGLIWLPQKVILLFSVLMMVGHNFLDPIVPSDLGSLDWFWKVAHESGWIPMNDSQSFGVYVAYPLIPWIGVMGAGYVFGRIMSFQPSDRQKFLTRSGLVMIASFAVLRSFNIYGDPQPFELQDTWVYSIMSFLNTTKYPPSLLFLLMTLGPSFLILAWLENKSGKLLEYMRIIGRVPFFFYVLHFIIIHLVSILVYSILYGEYFDMANTNIQNYPEEYEPRVWVVYAVWLPFMIFMTWLCVKYNRYKSTHNHWLLKYL